MTAQTVITIIQGGKDWSCLDDASEILVSSLVPGQYVLSLPTRSAPNVLCPKCNSTSIAYRRGDWMQCQTCGYGNVSKAFHHG